MERDKLKGVYHDEAVALQTKINVLKAKARGFVAGEITSFLGIIFFIVLITLSDSTLAKTIEGIFAIAVFGLYVVIRNRDVKNSERIAELERLRKAYAHEEAYLNGDFSAFDDGQRYANPQHPFTFDMDIFGKESLYQRINRTVTTGGADRLALYLSSLSPDSSSKGRVVKCLSDDNEIAWRMYFISCGIDKKIDTDAILKSLPALKEVNIPSYFGGRGIKFLAWVLIIGLFASIIAAVYGLVNPMLPIVWIFVNFFVVQGLANKYLREMLGLGNHLQNQMQPLMRLVKHVVRCEVTLPSNIEKLKDAESSFDALTNIIETLILRGNDAYRFFADAFGLRGLFLVSKFFHWRNMALDNLPEWIAAVSEIDALVSMAQFSSNHNSTTSDAVVVNSDKVVYEAKGLYHPFLGEKAVRNDFSIKDGNFYIITGANMAGKSTFLRAIGVNYILAMNGMPVFADNLTVSFFNLFTSMRTSDDLAHGISYFNAELLRLKQLIDQLDKSDKIPTLIILDEILKGTNSLDKLNGSRMFLRAMEDKPVTGIIATHDLELSKMEEESPRFHNYCFEIKLGTDVTYSYKITPGVARNQNATFLLKQLLK